MNSVGDHKLYTPPDWATGLGKIPKSRIKLAQLPTPIHPWSLPGLPEEFELYIKRDDLTGAALSGNKVRKLEFIFAEAIDQGRDTIITGGLIQSNNARATAVVAKELGLDCHLLLYGSTTTDKEKMKPTGNLLLSRMAGSTLGIGSDFSADPFTRVSTDCSDITAKLITQGKTSYSMELGGANAAGFWGYIEFFKEIIEQGALENFDDIVTTIGTGGTACSLAIANYLTGSKLRVHGMLVSFKVQVNVICEHMDSEISDVGLKGEDGQPLKSVNLMNIVDMQGKYHEEDLGFLTTVSTQTGIILDTTYTLKAVIGMLHEMKTNPDSFKGRRILFIHTGGLFGLATGKLDEILISTPETNKIHSIFDFIPDQ